MPGYDTRAADCPRGEIHPVELLSHRSFDARNDRSDFARHCHQREDGRRRILGANGRKERYANEQDRYESSMTHHCVAINAVLHLFYLCREHFGVGTNCRLFEPFRFDGRAGGHEQVDDGIVAIGRPLRLVPRHAAPSSRRLHRTIVYWVREVRDDQSSCTVLGVRQRRPVHPVCP